MAPLVDTVALFQFFFSLRNVKYCSIRCAKCVIFMRLISENFRQETRNFVGRIILNVPVDLA